MEAAEVLERLDHALNAHDLESLVDCFDEDVVSEQPVHPARAFRGRMQVEKNWMQLFAAFPHLEATLVRSAVDGTVVWAEWDWRADRPDGAKADMRGVTVLGVDDGRIEWVRFYMEPVEQDGVDIDAAIRTHTSSA
ncbi:MAG TPA: nuclear transport factor 2 family protein [Gaiellaceae bacterium]|nr:nuclear transport factor 2 family protein [Gaiellaceae bacterium]